MFALHVIASGIQGITSTVVNFETEELALEAAKAFRAQTNQVFSFQTTLVRTAPAPAVVAVAKAPKKVVEKTPPTAE